MKFNFIDDELMSSISFRADEENETVSIKFLELKVVKRSRLRNHNETKR